MSVEYRGPEHFFQEHMTVVLKGGHTDGMSEAAAAFVDWIESGFPDHLRVAGWASPEGSGVVRMKASDIVESAALLLAVPLPMPDDLRDAVREYVTATPIENEVSWLEDGETLNWTSAMFDLKLALAWRQEHAAVVSWR